MLATTQTVIKRTDLAEALAIALRAVASKSPLSITMSVKIGEGAIEATNLDWAIRTALAVDTEPVCVPAKLLHELVTAMGGAEVSLAVEKNKLVVTCGGQVANLKTYPAEEFPPIPTVGDGWSLQLPTAELKLALAQVVPAAATNESRPVLAGVLLKVTADRITLAAANGFQLAVRHLAVPGGEDRSAIVPARTLKEVARLLPDEGRVDVRIGRAQALFGMGETTLVTRLIEGSFPNYEQIVPKASTTTVVADAPALRRAVGVVAPVAERLGLVRVAVGEGGLHLSSSTAEVGDTAAAVPGEVTGDPVILGINARYLDEALEAIGEGDVRIGLTVATAPVAFRPAGRDDLVVVAMPMSGVPK